MIRVFIVGQNRLYCEALAGALEREEQLLVVGTETGAQEALARISELAPDVVLLETGLLAPGLVRAFLESAPAASILAIGVPEAEEEILRCAEAGVAGYATVRASIAELVSTIERSARGETRFPPHITALLLRRLASLAENGRTLDEEPSLTVRELEIVELIDEGLSDKQIGATLQISLPTVKTHVRNIIKKLRVRGRAQAATRARELHLNGFSRASVLVRAGPR